MKNLTLRSLVSFIYGSIRRVVKVKIRDKHSKTEVVLPAKLNDVQRSIYKALKITPEINKATIL